MKPENRDPYIMSPAAETEKKQTIRDIGVPYLPVEDRTEEVVLPEAGKEKLKKIFKIVLFVALAIIFVGIGIATLTDPSMDIFRIKGLP